MDEIIEVENWEYKWCDNRTGMPISGEPTGSVYSAHPVENYTLRYIQLGTKKYHKCGGVVVTKFDTRWEGHTSYTKFWLECVDCHAKFNEGEYE